MTPRLRDVRPADFDALFEIDGICFDASIAYSRRQLRDFLRMRGADCLIAEDAGQIVGFIVTARHRDEGYITTIDVLPDYRRHAVGSTLLAEAEKRLAANGVSEVSLETAIANASAIAFWQKHGYRKRGVIEGYYPGGRDAYSMTKSLRPTRKARS